MQCLYVLSCKNDFIFLTKFSLNQIQNYLDDTLFFHINPDITLDEYVATEKNFAKFQDSWVQMVDPPEQVFYSFSNRKSGILRQSEGKLLDMKIETADDKKE